MKIQLLPSSIESGCEVSQRQHLSCLVIDDRVAIDAGSLAFGCSELQRVNVRDVIVSHAHLDHIAGLPLFIDDLFSTLVEPIRVHATKAVIETLERDIFNWAVYPRFSELRNNYGPVVEYCPIKPGASSQVCHLSIDPVFVNHKVESTGFLVRSGNVSIGITGDTSSTDEIWTLLNSSSDLAAVLVECAFPNGLADLAERSHHMTPSRLSAELEKFERTNVPIYVVNIKPMYRKAVLEELRALHISNLEVFEVGRSYEF